MNSQQSKPKPAPLPENRQGRARSGQAGPKWKRERDRMYYASTPNGQAFVFGSPKPMKLWAWYVVWSLKGETRRTGSQAWVEGSMEKAKKQAMARLQCMEEAVVAHHKRELAPDTPNPPQRSDATGDGGLGPEQTEGK